MANMKLVDLLASPFDLEIVPGNQYTVVSSAIEFIVPYTSDNYEYTPREEPVTVRLTPALRRSSSYFDAIAHADATCERNCRE
jgi:hypothetical protein